MKAPSRLARLRLASFFLAPLFLAFLFLSLAGARDARAALTYLDDSGRNLKFGAAPARVVSLVPAATEALCAIGAGGSLKGITADDSYFECLIGVPRLGPAASPRIAQALELKPQLLILSLEQYERYQSALPASLTVLVWETPASYEALWERMALLGKIFRKEKEAQAAIAEGKDFLETIALKTALLSPEKRLKFLRVRARDGQLSVVPQGLDSLIIAAAGGTAPALEGDAPLALTPALLASLNPDFIYASGEDRGLIAREFSQKAFARIPAVQKRAVSYFPSALTDRLSAHAGYFVAWLSATAYEREFGDPQYQVYPNQALGEREIKIPGIPHVASAKVVDLRLFDFIHRTLLIEFTSPQKVVSTGDGIWEEATHVGNSSSPPMVWNIQHQGGWKAAEDILFQTLDLSRDRASLIFTGADMRNLAIKSASYRDLTVVALVTAGAESNALRASKDSGAFYEPGTINIILLSNRALSPGGAASAIVVATEAKSAALWDLDVRSSQTPLANPATGTGTDDVIVVLGGAGAPLDYTGGHAKIGELIARVVYDAVSEALRKQNGKDVARSAQDRLAERGIILEALGAAFPGRLATLMEDELLESESASLVLMAMALDDAREMGRLPSLGPFLSLAASFSAQVAGRPVVPRPLVERKDLPPALEAALNALATGLLARDSAQN
ncbi:MAG: adenosylcobinamide amidohydrolase [Deltaproteobacteria bacterium]|nr:adenosylcobinamide amidohydrolase [Deltaproteobacteria bacterium]